jgi:hypothetical protein
MLKSSDESKLFPNFQVLNSQNQISNLTFEIKMTKLTKKEASFKLRFDKPELVSMEGQNDLDFLKITFSKELLEVLKDSESG